MNLLECDLPVPAPDLHSAAARSELARLVRRAIPLAVVVLILNDVFGAVLRFVCVRLGASWLSYVPTLFALGVLLTVCATARLHRGVWLLSCFFAVHILYSFVLAASVRDEAVGAAGARIGFSLYTWTAFFLGALLMAERKETVLARSAAGLWLCAVVGVLVNKYVAFPWMDTNFEVLGQQVQVARDWTTNGIARLAGFSRASFSAANQIALFAVVLLSARRRPVLLQALIWLVSVYAIALTTSKTPLAGVVLAPLALQTMRSLRWFERSRALAFPLGMGLLVVLLGLMIALPLSSGLVDLLATGAPREYGFLTLASLLDRAAMMWPGAFELMTRDGAWFEHLFGRGQGGIGAAQAMFEPLQANSADSLFVFLYVTFGLGSVVFGLGLLLGFRRLYVEEPDTFELLFALSVALLTLGIATNVIESVVPALALGAVVQKGFCALTYRTATRQFQPPETARPARS
jgi:Ca2+/Na+ antiporter